VAGSDAGWRTCWHACENTRAARVGSAGMSGPPCTGVPSIYHFPSVMQAAWLPAPSEWSRHRSVVCREGRRA
jgi:hypothetical protein